MISGKVIPELYALKNLLYTTVRIVTYDVHGSEDGVGTAFFFHFDYFDGHDQPDRLVTMITNKHVVSGAKRAKIVFHLEPVVDNFPIGGTYDLEIDDFETKFIQHPDSDIDLCAIEISPFLEEVKKKTGKSIHYQAFSFNHIPLEEELKQIFPVTDVYMVGYPEGLWDMKNNLPITRRGVTASHPYFDFNGKSQGLVDIATFQGSSGSPIISYMIGPPRYGASSKLVFELLGILWGGEYSDADGKLITINIPTKKTQIPITKVMMHLGNYIKAKELLAFENLLTNRTVTI